MLRTSLHGDPVGGRHKLDRLLAAGDDAAIGTAAVAVGETLAALTAYGFPESGFFGPGLTISRPLGTSRESVVAYVRSCLFEREAGRRLGEDLAGQIWKLLRENAALLDEADGPATLVHGDYKAQNILLRQDHLGSWSMAAVLDWEFAMAGSSLFDLSILLRYADTLPPPFEQGVVTGYRAAGANLPQDWKRLIKLLDLVNLCEFLCSPDPREAMVGDITRLVQATCDGWQSF